MTCFNKEAILIDEANNKVPVTAFTNGLQSREFIFSIYKNDSKMMANMLFKATKYINAEDAMIVRKGRPKKRERQDNPHLEKRRKSANKHSKGRQEIKTSAWEDCKLHTPIYPVTSSPYTDKG